MAAIRIRPRKAFLSACDDPDRRHPPARAGLWSPSAGKSSPCASYLATLRAVSEEALE
jgi:hypothetical protein